MQRNRQKQILLSKKQMSKKHNSYIKTYKSYAYINQRPTSSKEAILKQTPFSKSILDRRREDITQAIDSTMNRVHQLDYDGH